MSPASLTYALLHERLKSQNRSAMVDALQSRRMRPEHRRVFDYFAEYPCAIVGSSLRDFNEARDVDLLFLAGTDFRRLAKEIGARYLGKFESPLTKGDVRRLSNINVEGVRLPVQCISDSTVATFSDWPHAVLLRSGELLNAGKHFAKDAA